MQIRFRFIQKNDPFFLSCGFVSNTEFAFRIDWIEKLNSKITRQLRRLMAAKQVEVVQKRLAGQKVETPSIDNLLSVLDLREYSKVELKRENILKKLGFRKGALEKSVVAYVIRGPKKNQGVGIHCEYLPALFFSTGLEVLIKDNVSPIIIKRNNEIVGLISPIKFIKE